jgi:hypothetical protein
MITKTELTATLEDHNKAFTEVSFLLEMLTSAVKDVVGNSTPSLGINAGRQMGKKLSIYLTNPTLEKVLKDLTKRLESGFKIGFKCDDAGAELGIEKCAIREVCATRKLQLGGELCQMFHYYLSGMTTELLGKPVRSGAIKADAAKCTARLDAK